MDRPPPPKYGGTHRGAKNGLRMATDRSHPGEGAARAGSFASFKQTATLIGPFRVASFAGDQRGWARRFVQLARRGALPCRSSTGDNGRQRLALVLLFNFFAGFPCEAIARRHAATPCRRRFKEPFVSFGLAGLVCCGSVVFGCWLKCRKISKLGCTLGSQVSASWHWAVSDVASGISDSLPEQISMEIHGKAGDGTPLLSWTLRGADQAAGVPGPLQRWWRGGDYVRELKQGRNGDEVLKFMLMLHRTGFRLTFVNWKAECRHCLEVFLGRIYC
ncbi:unnamed protein product [Amoebophrya sp. A25]|nr:unnamed protein product [Amoebophrya sp. A25]|eukprot:GSA25T00025821001.1